MDAKFLRAAALRRIEQAGGKLISKTQTQLYCGLQREWTRPVKGSAGLGMTRKFERAIQVQRETTMPDIKIEREEAGRSGRYVGRIAGIDGEAEITFARRGAKLISADHTGAPDTMKGTGAAMALVEFMIADARREGFKITPICPYLKAQYRKHPEWADVMVEASQSEADRT